MYNPGMGRLPTEWDSEYPRATGSSISDQPGQTSFNGNPQPLHSGLEIGVTKKEKISLSFALDESHL